VATELRRAIAGLGYPWFYVLACRGSICRLDADDPRDNDKRNRIVGPFDAVARQDTWFSRRVQGRSQNGALYFEIEEL
jgi:hypothetical protein